MYISITQKKSLAFCWDYGQRRPKAYNIADTTPSKEDELIKEQNLSQLLRFIKS
jgi:RNA polymerase sigma-70 factor (ECF subfamily)